MKKLLLILIIGFTPLIAKTIYKKDYGEKWAFTSNSAILNCFNDNGIKSPVVTINAKTYGLTGFADNRYGQKDLNAFDAVWKKGINTPRVDISPFRVEAMALCK